MEGWSKKLSKLLPLFFWWISPDLKLLVTYCIGYGCSNSLLKSSLVGLNPYACSPDFSHCGHAFSLYDTLPSLIKLFENLKFYFPKACGFEFNLWFLIPLVFTVLLLVSNVMQYQNITYFLNFPVPHPQHQVLPLVICTLEENVPYIAALLSRKGTSNWKL